MIILTSFLPIIVIDIFIFSYIYCMSHQTEWKLVADKQQL